MQWDRQGVVPQYGFGLAYVAAHSSLGLPTRPESRLYTEEEIESLIEQNRGYHGDLRTQFEGDESPKACSAIGQARSVVAVWLAAAAIDKGVDALDRALNARFPANEFIPGLGSLHRWPTSIGRPDADLASQLLAVPIDKVRGVLTSRWGEVVDPVTTSAELASWFGLTAPSYPAPDFVQAPCR